MSTNEAKAREIMGAYIEYPETYVERITAALNAKDAHIRAMREALEEQLKWKPNYLNDDGSAPDICDSDSWDDVSSHELRDILADVFTTAKKALSKLKEQDV